MSMQVVEWNVIKKLVEFDEYEEYLDNNTFQKLKEKAVSLINDVGYPIKCVVGLIYDLWLDYILSDEQESELYTLVDKDELFNDCSEYVDEWYETHSTNPLHTFIDEECQK